MKLEPAPVDSPTTRAERDEMTRVINGLLAGGDLAKAEFSRVEIRLVERMIHQINNPSYQINWRTTPTSLNGYTGRRHVATVYENGTWWTWDEAGIGGENGVEAGGAVIAIREAEAAVRRMLTAEEW